MRGTICAPSFAIFSRRFFPGSCAHALAIVQRSTARPVCPMVSEVFALALAVMHPRVWRHVEQGRFESFAYAEHTLNGI